MMEMKTTFMVAVLIVAAALFTGCMQVDIMVEMHDKDPGATITERIRVTRKLLDVCPAGEKRKKLLSHLSKESAQTRLKKMGKGIQLKSHKQDKLPDGSMQSIAVYTIPELRHLRIPNPFVHSHPPAARANINYGAAKYKGKLTGRMWLKSRVTNKKNHYPKALIQKVHTPLDRQILRELKPIIVDMISDFQARIRLKVPTRFSGGYVRNIKEAPKVTTLFSLSGTDLDRYGNGFFENEEIMLALLQMDFNAPDILKHTGTFPNNSSVPVLRAHGYGLRGAWAFSIHPTTYQRRKYLQKKKPPKKTDTK
mgnify:CR=1 FL=1